MLVPAKKVLRQDIADGLSDSTEDSDTSSEEEEEKVTDKLYKNHTNVVVSQEEEKMQGSDVSGSSVERSEEEVIMDAIRK